MISMNSIAPPLHELQARTPFSNSKLWEMQRDYYASMGAQAWRNGEVPDYITTNPHIAHANAQACFALLQDQPAESDTPLLICELGGGSGRFAYSFLRSLQQLCDEAGIAHTRFLYVLTDYVESNIDCWQAHPHFAPFISAGVLDFAQFDVAHPDTLHLRISGRQVSPGSLALPAVVIANYVFDSVPQDLYHIREGQAHPADISLHLNAPPGMLDLRLAIFLMSAQYYAGEAIAVDSLEPEIAALLSLYCRELQDSWILLPRISLQCLAFFKSLSPCGAMLITADKGEMTLTGLEGHKPPELVKHGATSVNLNFHALMTWCEQQGGSSIGVPNSSSIGMGVLFMTQHNWPSTRLAVQRHLADFTPADFCSLALLMKQTRDTLDIPDIIAVLRLAQGDFELLGWLLPRLLEMIDQFEHSHVAALIKIGALTRQHYFPTGRKDPWCLMLADLFRQVGYYAEALRYYDYANALNGESVEVLRHQLACHEARDEVDAAVDLRERITRIEAEAEAAA